ncbi:MAG TPA: phage tail tip lysozyme [Polyangia bacterium]|nr:phage tail tip lysozyme [Polyangia bacterium]
MSASSRLVLASLAATALAGCIGAPPPPAGELTQASSTAFANDKPAFDFFVGKGFTNFQAAGIVGNLDQESGVDPTIAQFGGGPGRGIAQWSTGGRWDTSANDNVVWYAGTRGESATSLNLQLEFIWYELTTFGYGFSQLKATTNVTDATVVFMDKYEICGTCAQSQRVSYAQSVLSAYGVTPSYAASFVSQSWPYASAPAFTVKCGESVAANIVLKNTGSKAWDGSTKLGTTMPRDRASIFAGSGWLAPNRAAAIGGSVAPNADGTFSFSFDGPTGAACVPGTYHEFFGVVQEGVAWFSDNGQGGPPDNQLEAVIDLVPGNPPPPADLGGTTGGDDGGAKGTDDGGAKGGDDGGAAAGGGDAGYSNDPNGHGGNPPGGGLHGGCSAAGSSSSDGLVLALLVCCALFAARRKSRIN